MPAQGKGGLMEKNMKISLNKDEFGPTTLMLGENTFIHLENDWPQIWGEFNWKTYRLADIQYEDDVMLGGHEFIFVLLGFGFRFRHNNPDNEIMNDMSEIAKELEDKKK